MNINILSKPKNNIFGSQYDSEQFDENEYRVYYNSKEDIVWDAVVVYENISEEYTVKCKKGGLLYFCGEPPIMHPLPYVFLKKYDAVILPHKNVRHKNKITSHGFLNWLFCFSFSHQKCLYKFEELSNLDCPKSKIISFITSNQKLMPGHQKRMALLTQLQKDFPNDIDFYGRGIKEIDSKAEALIPYMFTICIENTSIDNYWTEKFSDALLGKCIPIYSGCRNIDDYFDNKGYLTFDVEKYEELKSIIKRILENPHELYKKYQGSMLDNRKRLMDKENIIPFIYNYIYQHPSNDDIVQTHTVKPLGGFVFKVENWFIRFKRFTYKIYFQYFK